MNEVDNIPSATDDIAETNEDEAVTFNVLDNDTGLEDGGLVVTIPTQPTGGSVLVNDDNTVTVTPDAGYVGDIIFTYQLCDADNDCSTATVTVTVNEVDNIPSATDDIAETNEDEAVTFNVLDNDTGLEDGGLVVTIPTQPTGGSVVVNDDNTVTVTPDADYVGDIVFTYQVCDADNDCSIATVTVTVNEVVVDNTPSATVDNAETNEGEAVAVDVLANDTGLEDGGLVVTIPTQPTGGSVVVNDDNTVTVTPDADYVGDIVFTYQVCDADNDCSTATVTVTVNPVNEAPEANDDIVSVIEGKVLEGPSLLENDEDPDGDELLINTTPVTEPLYGDLVIYPDGTYTYTPDKDFSGEDSFEYEVCDDGSPQECSTAVVHITVIESDTDGDGILDEDEGEGDTDEDGIPDKEDLDSDNDSILDEDEGDVDTDGDDIPDYKDTDSDNDGIDDVDEGDVDTDNDGEGDYRDIDSDDDGVLDSNESTGDCDRDGIPNRIDEDKCYEEDELEVYEVFSPNGDGTNDYFVLPWLTQYDRVSIEIFNRWGNVVYQSDKYNNDWNGQSNKGIRIGDQLPVGTYFYIIKVHDINKTITGNTYLNR
ncbi:tandem-95 repeat protein [Labilibacter sediminis]|nr:tandem-95 repeat protein [Labilibacter sediminis]